MHRRNRDRAVLHRVEVPPALLAMVVYRCGRAADRTRRNRGPIDVELDGQLTLCTIEFNAAHAPRRANAWHLFVAFVDLQGLDRRVADAANLSERSAFGDHDVIALRPHTVKALPVAAGCCRLLPEGSCSTSFTSSGA